MSSYGIHKSSLFHTFTRGTSHGRNVSGFSLIEVLVATALLVMIVGMIGFVFRQSSMSWESGTRRADGISQIRAVAGAIERDLRLAVDAREFKGLSQSFGQNSLEFIALADPDPDNPDDRALVRVTYSGGKKVERRANRLQCSGDTWNASGREVRSILLDGGKQGDPNISFSVPDGYQQGDGLPAYVTIEADIDVTESFSGLTVRSKGPSEKGSGDDIVAK